MDFEQIDVHLHILNELCLGIIRKTTKKHYDIRPLPGENLETPLQS